MVECLRRQIRHQMVHPVVGLIPDKTSSKLSYIEEDKRIWAVDLALMKLLKCYERKKRKSRHQFFICFTQKINKNTTVISCYCFCLKHCFA